MYFDIGKHLASLNITPSDTRDSLGLATFHGFNLQKLFFPGSTILSNYYKYSVFPTKCCSHRSSTFKVSSRGLVYYSWKCVLFKVTDSDMMYTYYYLLYKLQIFTNEHLENVPATIPALENSVSYTLLFMV